VAEKPSKAAERRGESELERVDRNLEELLAELRVALPGVQVLFAFLLILPFNQRFSEVNAAEEKIYLFTLACTALSSVLLIAPSFHHRLQFRRDRKEQVLHDAHRMTIAGLAFLAAAMCGAVALVGSFVFGAVVGTTVAAGLLVAFATIWLYLPLRRH
jgi:hypothetical protein